jgi:serine protease Do
MNKHKNLIIVISVIFIIIGLLDIGHANLQQSVLSHINPFANLKLPGNGSEVPVPQTVKVVSEESVVIDVVDKVSPTVVTVGIVQSQATNDTYAIDPFNILDPFRRVPSPDRSPNAANQEEDIGSGFIVGADGLIVTNKHVVTDTEAKYRVITKDNKSYDVQKIYRDPVNDLAILKINASGLATVEMGDSDKIKVGQTAIAIGTALGQFRNTVTTGVISGVGRGITAGTAYEGEAEQLDNVIQTSAAINPGNSGGPLLNSTSQVIGINTAVSSEGQNVGFALPINVVRDAINNFDKTGQFNRAFLGIHFKTVTQDVAVMNDLPEGAYVIDTVTGSPAEKAGIKADDIITKIDGQKLTGSTDLSAVIGKHKPGDRLNLTVWRAGKQQDLELTLGTQG